VLSTVAVYVLLNWPENYGDKKAPVHKSFVDALWTIKNGESLYPVIQ